MEQFENVSHFTVIWNTNVNREKLVPLIEQFPENLLHWIIWKFYGIMIM